MNDFIENFKKDLNEIGKKLKAFWAKITGKSAAADGSVVNAKVGSTYEINLVPEVKMQMIKAQKMRNLVLFVCIVVSSVAVSVVLVLFGIKSGQDIAMAGKDTRLALMSQKLNEYAELNDLVTIQGQLTGITDIAARRTVISRVFGALAVMVQQGADDVKLSELRVDLDSSTLTLEGQTDARVEPLIDYRVLESFKKGVALTKYDYGRFVDIDGKELPTQCIREADAEGNAYKVDNNNYYAWWDLTIEGCEGAPRSLNENPDIEFHYSANAQVETGLEGVETRVENRCDENGENCQEVTVRVDNGEVVNPEAVQRVKIWRTPQFDEWYKSGNMELDGSITGIQHFESVCYSYSGTEVSGVGPDDSNVRWTSTNDCLLAPDGFEVESSSNARDESDNLVLKFSGKTVFESEFFAFGNKHMIAIGPMGQNVTDSYIQIGSMFTAEARECEADDTECLSNLTNKGGN